MGAIKQEIQLVDKVSPNLSNIEKNAIRLSKEYERLQKEQDNIYKSMEALEKAGQANSEVYKNLANVYVEYDRKLIDIANGTYKIKDANDSVIMSATELNQSLELLSKAWGVVQKATQQAYEWMDRYNVQFNAEFTAGNALRTLHGYSGEQIQDMFGYAKTLQSQGVVGDEAIISGMQELTKHTRGATNQQLKDLTKLTLDLAVSENGLETSMSNVNSTASMLGRALDGQTLMLKRNYGLTEAEIQSFNELSDKSEKVNKLYEVMRKHVGNVNEELANLSQGSLKQTRNKMNDLYETLGEKVTPYIAAFEEAIYKLLKPALEWVADNMEWIAPIFIALAAVIGIVIVALTALAIQNFIAGASWLASLWPILLVVAAIGLVVAACVFVMKKIDETTGKTRSALGLITGMISTFVAILYDIFIFPVWNAIAELANFFGNFLDHPLEATQITLMEFAWNALDVLYGLASALDHIFGSNLASGIDSVMGKIKNAQNELKEATDYKEYMQKLDFWDIDKAARQGYDFGASISDNISKGIEQTDFFAKFGDALTVDDMGNSALNTTSKEGLLSDEDIQLLLDVATRDYKLNYQQITPEITLTFGDVHQEVDLENAIDVLADELESIYAGDLGGVPA